MFAHGPAPVQDHASTSTHRAFKFPNLAAAPAPRPPASNPISAAAKAPEPAGRELDTLIEQRLRAAAMRGFGYASNVPVQWASVDLAAAARATSALSNQAAAVGGTPVLLSTSVVPARATGVDLAAAARSTPLVPARATDIDLRGAARGTTGMLARATDVDLAAAARATSSLTAQETAIDLAAAARATSALTAQATAHSRLNNQKVAPALVMGDPLSPSAAEQPERQSAIQVAPQITPQAPEATPHSVPAAYWYYCRHPSGYYPYVKQCYGRWERVMPRPSVRG
jgi:hypothetical protein